MCSDPLVDQEAGLIQASHGQMPFAVKKGEIWPYLKIPGACWYSIDSDDQGGGVLEGDYTDYIVDDLFATKFKYNQLKQNENITNS